jgi:FAD/FMN-containing dehydrogenase
LRVNTLVSDLAEHLEAPDLEGIAYAASGTVILYGMADRMAAGETVRTRMARAGAAGGSAVLECGPVQLRRQVDVWGSARPEWKFTRGIRRTLDPALVLNRGRYVGGV